MSIAKQQTCWIWYPGDFEIYHGMLQNFQREERGYGWPAYWKMDDWRKNVKFHQAYTLKEETEFIVYGYGEGYVAIDEKKYPFNQKLKCSSGVHKIEIYIGNMTKLPCVYVEGDMIFSDNNWQADDFENETHVGYSSLYTEKDQNPNVVYYQEKTCKPQEIKGVSGGVLFDFKRMINGTIELEFKDKDAAITVAYGESEAEATDLEWCYYKQENVTADTKLRKRAFRYIFIPNCKEEDVICVAIHQYMPLNPKAEFQCDNDELNRIWEVAKETYSLCSGLFFIDGIKRDRWIWSGDAYQNYFVNPYLNFDEEIDKRTIRALRGNQIITQHINTIVDYSMLWLISIENEYWMTGDTAFIEEMYPKMVGMMDLFLSQTNELGFIYGRERDWIFIDWTDMDKEGCVCAEQILLLKSYQTMQFCGNLLGKETSDYEKKAEILRKNLFTYYWKDDKGAFIDSYESGKNHITRHANIFAILFDLVDEKQKDSIMERVLLNDNITQITTPYFKFFELDVMGKTGHLDYIYDTIKEYWGGMLKRDAVTFWEDFDKNQTGVEQYGMYGDPFGKSLCHAWAASPIYLLGKYFLGVRPLTPGYETYEVKPQLKYFKELDCKVPIKKGVVHIIYKNEKLEVSVDSNCA